MEASAADSFAHVAADFFGESIKAKERGKRVPVSDQFIDVLISHSGWPLGNAGYGGDAGMFGQHVAEIGFRAAGGLQAAGNLQIDVCEIALGRLEPLNGVVEGQVFGFWGLGHRQRGERGDGGANG